MTVKIDGVAVRGYKREQFEDAWERVLGVTRVTSVTPEARSHAGGSAGNGSNALDAMGDENGYPTLTDAEMADLVALETGPVAVVRVRLWFRRPRLGSRTWTRF